MKNYVIDFYRQDKLGFFSILFFILITFPSMITHLPHMDETQAYMVSYFMTLENFVEIMRNHGHPIIWYLLMMPFSKLNIGYPYSILFLNYIFAVGAVIYMWKKAPFPKELKFIITFSYMFVSYFSIIARCYSVGILGLFIIASLFREQTKRPILYAVLLGITANTSAVAAISVSSLGIIFLYNIYKERLKIPKVSRIISILILLSFFIFCVYPFCFDILNIIPKEYYMPSFAKKILFEFFIPNNNLLFLLSYLVLLYTVVFFAKKELKDTIGNLSIFFVVSTIVFQLLFMFFVYHLNIYHCYFFLINIIVAIWIQNSFKVYDFKQYMFLFIIIFSLVMFYPRNHDLQSSSSITYDFIESVKNEKEQYFGSSIIFYDKQPLIYLFAPFFIHYKSIQLFNGLEKYSYKFQYKHSTVNEIDCFVKQINTPVYIFSVFTQDLPYKKIRKVKFDAHNDVAIYRVK